MKCKHENADHLMPGDSFEPWISDDVAVIRSFAKCEQLRCLDCEEWLSLGPANDDDERVKIETRAARLASDYSNLDMFVGYEWYGRLDAGGTRSGVDNLSAEDLHDYLCGFLANCITEHEGTP